MKPLVTLGDGKATRTKISVGIPTVRRPSGVSYLYPTLMSLFHNLLPVNEDDVTVTLYVADDNMTYVNDLMVTLQRNFTREINLGLLQVSFIHPLYSEMLPFMYRITPHVRPGPYKG